MEIIGEDYKVFLFSKEQLIKMEGSIRLRDTKAYADVLELLKKGYDDCNEGITVDLRELEFLNSSGINTISKFVLYVRKQNNPDKFVRMFGSESIYWQKKSLQNLQKLFKKIELEFS